VKNIDMSMLEGQLRKALACGLNPVAKSLKTFVVNGYKFQTVHCERYRKIQNSWVMVEADR